MYDLSRWLIGKPVVDLLFTLIELFWLSIMDRELWGEMCTARLFSQVVDLFALKFQLDRFDPINHFWREKTMTLSYLMVKTASICVPLFWHNTGVWRTDGWTDGRTDRGIFRIIYSACIASFAGLCKKQLMKRLKALPYKQWIMLCIVSIIQFHITRRRSKLYNHASLVRPGRGPEYCNQFVCLSVCLFVREHITGIAGSIFTKCFVQIPCGRGSVLLWRLCDTLCISGFMDDVTFGRNGPYGD